VNTFLVVGLGNVGDEYADTRHNIGFMAVDALARADAGTWALDRHAYRAEVKHKGRTLILLKPTTYMNLSGRAVQHHLAAAKVPLDRLLIVTDDLALPFGELRLRGKGSDGGHNGLKDITATLGHANYARLRLGIGAEFSAGRQVDYVLSPFTRQEQADMPFVIDAAVACVHTWVFRGLGEAMGAHNKNVLRVEPPKPPKAPKPAPAPAPNADGPNTKAV